MSPYYLTTISITNAILPHYRLPTAPQFEIWRIPAENIFTCSWLAYMKSLELEINHAMVFYRNYSNQRNTPHQDLESNGKPCNFALNWCIGGSDSHMVWYETPLDWNSSSTHLIKSKTPYRLSKTKNLQEIARYTVPDSLTLVNTAIPHTVIMGSEPRWCISARTVRDPSSITWTEIVEIMREKQLVIET